MVENDELQFLTLKKIVARPSRRNSQHKSYDPTQTYRVCVCYGEHVLCQDIPLPHIAILKNEGVQAPYCNDHVVFAAHH
jgi:hypothetical protein